MGQLPLTSLEGQEMPAAMSAEPMSTAEARTDSRRPGAPNDRRYLRLPHRRINIRDKYRDPAPAQSSLRSSARRSGTQIAHQWTKLLAAIDACGNALTHNVLYRVNRFLGLRIDLRGI